MAEVLHTPEHETVVVHTQPRSTVGHVIYYILDIVEFFLALRFIFALFSASSTNIVVSIVYRFTDPLVAPFRGMFPIQEQAIIEWPTLIAMVVYALIAYILVRLARS